MLTALDFDEYLSRPRGFQTNVTLKPRRLISAHVDGGQRSLIKSVFGARQLSVLTARCRRPRLNPSAVIEERKGSGVLSRAHDQRVIARRGRRFTETPTLCFAFWVLFENRLCGPRAAQFK